MVDAERGLDASLIGSSADNQPRGCVLRRIRTCRHCALSILPRAELSRYCNEEPLICSVLILGTVAAISLLLNVRMIFNSSVFRRADAVRHPLPRSIANTLAPAPDLTDLSHLVIVAGHAIWLGGDVARAREDEDWVLEPRQHHGSVPTFNKHVERGVEIAASDPSALLVMSGGATRPAYEGTEADSTST